jgi:hypothetical protein
MQNRTLELISGASTSALWETLEDILTSEDSPAHIHYVLRTLHDCGNDKAAFSLVRILYDISGITLPDVVEELDKNDDTRSAYAMELLADIESII